MNRATVVSFSAQQCGSMQLEALVHRPSSDTDSNSFSSIEGMSFTVQRGEHLQALHAFYGEDFKLEKCIVKEEGPEWAQAGWTFVWSGMAVEIRWPTYRLTQGWLITVFP
jgi:hypothetical protein